MIDSEILKKLQGTSIQERILVIEAILQTVLFDYCYNLKSTVSSSSEKGSLTTATKLLNHIDV
ncbi:MAG: hypothetical protein F6K54_23800 [Okeania sp. SIO3B5]|uniref:hypothetical protein n=1 Tax=Okeania sp. SIO3B5 TaxID=2607811 RepID=UPI0013FF5656|nr:hypothetical protein [Okeania sp. SIO3B5]NEO55825.1 hypothetical protein [Okeania sp. SIO3B5]